jgi:ppGpp synthetase/RelA/SpoT-type nucleotidyltranferase
MRDDEVRGHALRALRGAEKFAEQFDHALRMGPESIYRVAYAVKMRVKSEDSLVEKILHRSRIDPDYSAYKVKDIVGVRFVCIHGKDLYELCNLFVRSIPFLQSPSVQLLEGAGTDGAIEEVIVYKTGSSSRDYDDCLNFFRTLEPDLRSNKVLERRLDKQDLRQYSSIHILCRGRFFYNGIYLKMPVEVQIRTAFEDVWGAIQHDVEYKRKFITPIDRKLEERYDNAILQLNALKMALEGATRQADVIKAEIDHMRRITEPTAPASVRAIRRRLDSAGRERFPYEIRDAAVALDAKIDEIFQLVAAKYKNPDGVVEAIDALQEGLRLIEEFIKRYSDLDRKRYEGDSEGRFHIYMDRALIHFWLSRVYMRNGQEDEALLAIGRAVRIYKTLQATTEYRKDAVLEYRLGHALLSSGAIPEAVVLLEAAVEHLPGAGRLEKKDLLRALIPRQLGYALWRLAQSQTNGLRADLLARAVHASMKSFAVFEPADLRDRDDLCEALMYATNNAVSYIGAIYIFVGANESLSIFDSYRHIIQEWVQCTNLRQQTSPPVVLTVILLDLLEQEISLMEMCEAARKLLESIEAGDEPHNREYRELKDYIRRLIRAAGNRNDEGDSPAA